MPYLHEIIESVQTPVIRSFLRVSQTGELEVVTPSVAPDESASGNLSSEPTSGSAHVPSQLSGSGITEVGAGEVVGSILRSPRVEEPDGDEDEKQENESASFSQRRNSLSFSSGVSAFPVPQKIAQKFPQRDLLSPPFLLDQKDSMGFYKYVHGAYESEIYGSAIVEVRDIRYVGKSFLASSLIPEDHLYNFSTYHETFKRDVQALFTCLYNFDEVRSLSDTKTVVLSVAACL